MGGIVCVCVRGMVEGNGVGGMVWRGYVWGGMMCGGGGYGMGGWEWYGGGI